MSNTKEILLDNFGQFFTKLIQNHPLHDDLQEQLSSFRHIINSDSTNYIQTKTFIHSLYQRSLMKPAQNPTKSSGITPSVYSSLPIDPSLKNFTSEKFKYPFSLLTKFTYTSFKDYLNKNSILMPPESSVREKYSHVREFLPDSQNFYRALGLGILEAFLIEPALLPRVREWYNKIFNRELMLNTQLYPFNSEELRSIFCGYLRQLIQVREDSEETVDGKKSRRLLYQMDSKDTVFDIALISFVKEVIMNSQINSPNLQDKGFNNRIKVNDSSVISDLLIEVPQIFAVDLVVLTIQSKASNEIFYNYQNIQQNNATPKIFILNEKQLSYQNFCVLNLDNMEGDSNTNNTSIDNIRLSSMHTRNQSAQLYTTPNLSSATTANNIGTNTNTATRTSPEQTEKVGKDLPFSGRKFESAIIKDRKTPTKADLRLNSNSKLKTLTIETGDKEPQELIPGEEISPKHEILSLSKILSGYMGHVKKDSILKDNRPSTTQARSNVKPKLYDLPTKQSAILETNLAYTPRKPDETNKENEKNESPINFTISPLTLDLTPAAQLQEQEQSAALKSASNRRVEKAEDDTPIQIHAFVAEDNFASAGARFNIAEPLKLLQKQEPNQIQNDLSKKADDLKNLLKPSFNLPNDLKTMTQNPNKLMTSLPKFMSTIPSNPFTSNPFSGGNPMNETQPSRMQSQNFGSGFSRFEENFTPIQDSSISNYHSNPVMHRRFSLNPMQTTGHPSIDQIGRRYGATDRENMNF